MPVGAYSARWRDKQSRLQSRYRGSTPHRPGIIVKPYPKDNEPRTFGVRPVWLDAIAEHIKANDIAGELAR